MCVCVFVYMCVKRGEDLRGTGNDHKLLRFSIWGLGPAWNSKISLLPWQWKNLLPLSGSSGTPRGSAQKSACGQPVFTVIRPLLQVCVHTRKSVKPPRIKKSLLCYRQLVHSSASKAGKENPPHVFFWKIISKLHIKIGFLIL